MLKHCPHCNSSMDGGPVPEHLNQPYEYEGEIWYPYGKDARWSREIGIEDPYKYDGCWEFECPDCHKRWPSTAQLLNDRDTWKKYGLKKPGGKNVYKG